MTPPSRLQGQLAAGVQEVGGRREARDRHVRGAAAQRAADRAPARALAALLLSRGWRIGGPQITVGAPPRTMRSHAPREGRPHCSIDCPSSLM